MAAIADAGGAPRESLGRSIDRLFDEERVGKTDALLIVKRGTLIVERYGDGIEADTRLPGWSAGQCITALMIGQLVSDGRLRSPNRRLFRNGSVLAIRAASSPCGSCCRCAPACATSRQRQSARAGYPAIGSHAHAVPRRQGRHGLVCGGAAAGGAGREGVRAFVRERGHSLRPCRARTFVRPQSGSPPTRGGEYLRHRVLAPIGMNSTLVAYDRAGTMIGSGMIAATARDWSKLGEFLRHSGSVKGAQILPRRWVQFMLEPSPREPAYGAGVWLNRGEAGDGARLWPATAPRSVFACLGEYGQYVIGSPDQLLTVVRIGHSNPEQEREVRDELGALLALFPKN
ncbi:serine hydrolase [Novosphingobium panipatense]